MSKFEIGDKVVINKDIHIGIKEIQEAFNKKQILIVVAFSAKDNWVICELPDESRWGFDCDKLELAYTDISKVNTVLVTKLTTLPTDSDERKQYPMLSGCLKYFPAAIAGVSKISKLGNEKHNPGQPLHHARGKSMDHGDCIIRHLTDVEDLLAQHRLGNPNVTQEMILLEVNQMAWRALAYSQMLQESFGAPLAPGAKKD